MWASRWRRRRGEHISSSHPCIHSNCMLSSRTVCLQIFIGKISNLLPLGEGYSLSRSRNSLHGCPLRRFLRRTERCASNSVAPDVVICARRRPLRLPSTGAREPKPRCTCLCSRVERHRCTTGRNRICCFIDRFAPLIFHPRLLSILLLPSPNW